MKEWLGKGWGLAVRLKYAGLALFLYRFLWGFFLFRFVGSIVSPILARYPDQHPSADAVPLFLIEAEFRLLRTDLADSLLWTLAGLLMLRMLITPLIDAGLFYSFHHARSEEGTRLLAGIRQVWKPVALLYLAENTLLLLPAVWIFPVAKSRFMTAGSAGDWLLDMLPYAAGWLVWGFVVHLLFRCMQFGAAGRENIVKALVRGLRRGMLLLAVSLAIAGIGLALSAAVSAASAIWPGLAAVVIHQSFHLVRALLALWTAASQFSVWSESEA